jgi:dCTP diphosphatase
MSFALYCQRFISKTTRYSYYDGFFHFNKQKKETVFMNIPMKSIEDLRRTAFDFVNERDWHKFHTPCNVFLALCGEVGEIAECFQWKGNIESDISSMFTNEEVIHIGEEISDVLIYLIRLADIMRIDLGVSVLNKINSCELDTSKLLIEPSQPWSNCSLAEMHAYAASKYSHKNPRFYCLQLIAVVGRIGSLFSSTHESECMHSAKRAAADMAEVAIFCTALANVMGLEIGVITARKFERNRAKYPAQIVKGSSDKYTKYLKSSEMNTFTLCVLVTVGTLIGYLAAKRR